MEDSHEKHDKARGKLVCTTTSDVKQKELRKTISKTIINETGFIIIIIIIKPVSLMIVWLFS